MLNQGAGYQGSQKDIIAGDQLDRAIRFQRLAQAYQLGGVGPGSQGDRCKNSLRLELWAGTWTCTTPGSAPSGALGCHWLTARASTHTRA